MDKPGNLTALVVDDYADSRRILRRMLEMRRLRVVEASSGEEALEVARRERPDIVFMDLYMPGMCGLEAARRMRELAAGRDRLVFIACTAYDTDDLREQAGEAGCDYYLVKPFGFDDLDRVLRPHLPSP